MEAQRLCYAWQRRVCSGGQGWRETIRFGFPISTCKIAMTILGSPLPEKNGVIDWTDNRTPALGWFPFPFSPHKQCYSIGTAFM